MHCFCTHVRTYSRTAAVSSSIKKWTNAQNSIEQVMCKKVRRCIVQYECDSVVIRVVCGGGVSAWSGTSSLCHMWICDCRNKILRLINPHSSHNLVVACLISQGNVHTYWHFKTFQFLHGMQISGDVTCWLYIQKATGLN